MILPQIILPAPALRLCFESVSIRVHPWLSHFGFGFAELCAPWFNPLPVHHRLGEGGRSTLSALRSPLRTPHSAFLSYSMLHFPPFGFLGFLPTMSCGSHEFPILVLPALYDCRDPRRLHGQHAARRRAGG